MKNRFSLFSKVKTLPMVPKVKQSCIVCVGFSDSQCSKKNTNKSRHRLEKQSIGTNQDNTFGSKCEKHNNKDIQNYIYADPPSTH